jgi:hypothetical protein
MKIYLAAKYSRHPEMRDVRERLQKIGHLVTSRWIEGNHEISEVNADADRQRFAVEDWMDLKDAEAVLWFAEPEKIEGRNRGGRHVEFGLAIAWNIPVFVVGRKENVFHWLPEVRHFASPDEALTALTGEVRKIQGE